MINNKDQLSEKILKIIKDIQDNSLDWVNLTRIGPLLTIAGIDFKEYGYARLRPFLNVFDDILELKEIVEDDKPAVWYVRPTTISNSSIAEKQNEEKCDFVSNLEAPEILNGKIQWVKYDDEYRFKGVIETEEHGTFFFTGDSWLNKSLSVEDICDNADVEFELKKPNKKNIVFPKNIRFKRKDIVPNYESDLCINHSYGSFKSFVTLSKSLLETAFSIVLGDFDENTMIAKLESTYNKLSENDFEFDQEDKTVIFFSGFEKDEDKIYLYCTENTKHDKAKWYCERIKYKEQIIGGSVFGKIKADWYDILSDLNKCLAATDETDANIVAQNIIKRCMKADSLIWIYNGKLSNEDKAEFLFAPTGYFNKENKELYLSCSYRRGIKGKGWYYDYITYENAPIDTPNKKYWLKFWADFKWEDVFEQISKQTLEEKWSFGDRNDYTILKNYLNYVFADQWEKRAIKYSEDGKYAAFNTGLPEKGTYQYLYAFCERIKSDTDRHPLVFSPQYELKSFVVAGRAGDGKILSNNIHPLPPPSKFITRRSDTVWELDFNDNNQLTVPECDDMHILIQRCDRLPLDFYRRAAYSSETFKNILNSETSDFQKYNEIREFLKPEYDNNADDEVAAVYRILYGNLKNVIDTAVRKLAWNWRAVVPCYNPEKNKPCYLLPVTFGNSDCPDRAMIASYNEDTNKYRIETVLPLEWAYLDARLVCRPESEWLAVDNIT